MKKFGKKRMWFLACFSHTTCLQSASFFLKKILKITRPNMNAITNSMSSTAQKPDYEKNKKSTSSSSKKNLFTTQWVTPKAFIKNARNYFKGDSREPNGTSHLNQ